MVQKAIFAVFDQTNSTEPWITDGTAAGTMLLKDINPGSSQSLNSTFGFKSLGSKVVFGAQTNANGKELWVTDGTAAGTFMLQDINSGINGSNPNDFVVLGTKMVFTANDPVNGREMWVTDGTTAGTFLLKETLARATVLPGGSSMRLSATKWCSRPMIRSTDWNSG